MKQNFIFNKIIYLKIILYIISLNIFKVLCNDISNFEKPNILPKYFGIDIDKTFYIEDSNEFKNNIESFKYLKSNNIIPFFSTGRYIHYVKKLLMSNFNNDDQYFYPGVYLNGSLVYNSNKNIIFKGTFEKEFIKNFINFVNIKNLKKSCLFLTPDKIVSLDNINELKNELTLGLKYEIKTQSEIENMDIVSIRIKEFTDNLEFGIEDKDYRKFDEYNIRIFVFVDSWKHKGIQKLLENINGKTNELAYIGDSENDICVLKLNDVLSFVVNNASNEVKKYAKWVVDLNYDQGAFAKVVQLLLKDENSHS